MQTNGVRNGVTTKMQGMATRVTSCQSKAGDRIRTDDFHVGNVIRGPCANPPHRPEIGDKCTQGKSLGGDSITDPHVGIRGEYRSTVLPNTVNPRETSPLSTSPILSIDPSSTCSGYAIMEGERSLREAGCLRPRRSTDQAIYRIAAMARQLEDLIAEHHLRLGVIEITSGKVARRRGGCGAGLAVYGMAVGALFWAMFKALDGAVMTVHENDWTRGIPKRRRARTVEVMFPQYRGIEDPGLDVADAIGIGVWYYGLPARRMQSHPAHENKQE